MTLRSVCAVTPDWPLGAGIAGALPSSRSKLGLRLPNRSRQGKQDDGCSRQDGGPTARSVDRLRCGEGARRWHGWVTIRNRCIPPQGPQGHRMVGGRGRVVLVCSPTVRSGGGEPAPGWLLAGVWMPRHGDLLGMLPPVGRDRSSPPLGRRRGRPRNDPATGRRGYDQASSTPCSACWPTRTLSKWTTRDCSLRTAS